MYSECFECKRNENLRYLKMLQDNTILQYITRKYKRATHNQQIT